MGQMQVVDRDHRAGGSAVSMLRRETLVSHRRLERKLGLMSGSLSVADYGSLLVGFASVHQTLDDEIAGQLRLLPEGVLAEVGSVERRRMPALAVDLDRLGLSLPRPVAFPLTSVAGAFGALYVSEGATLGGRVIARHIRSVLGRDVPVVFFESSGVDVDARWSSCRAVIDRGLVTASDRSEAARVAVAVFDQFSKVLCR